jgi:hypothetical protein
MILAGLLSTMNMWANKIDDIRFSLNDLYMIGLMVGWMILFMAIYYKDIYPFLVGLILVLFNFYAIRVQLFINEKQYLLGMIPHHSMAVLMSKRLLEKNDITSEIKNFANNIMKNQSEEIQFMKNRVK